MRESPTKWILLVLTLCCIVLTAPQISHASDDQTDVDSPPVGLINSSTNVYIIAAMICVTVLIGLGIMMYAVTRNEFASRGVFRSPNSFRGGVVFVVVLSTVFLSIVDKYSGPIATLFGTIIGFVLSSDRHSRDQPAAPQQALKEEDRP